MKWLRLFLILAVSLSAFGAKAQHIALPHGMVFGAKPKTMGMMDADKLRSYMGEKKRISVVLRDTITQINHEKGGWFTMQAGASGTLYAHFKDYNVKLPKAMEGRIVIVEAVAVREFTAADSQHFAGEANGGTSKKPVADAISLEISGLVIDK